MDPRVWFAEMESSLVLSSLVAMSWGSIWEVWGVYRSPSGCVRPYVCHTSAREVTFPERESQTSSVWWAFPGCWVWIADLE